MQRTYKSFVIVYYPSTGLVPIKMIENEGTPHTCLSWFPLLSLLYVKLVLVAHWKLKFPLKNIKPVTVGGYIYTIFGGSFGGVSSRCHKRQYLVYGTI